MLRRYKGATPTVIKIWTTTDIPGGAPAASGWQKLGLTVSDGQLWAYYNDNLLPGSPFADTTYKSGYFGAYYFWMADISKTTLYDDIIVRQVLTSVDEGSTSFAPSQFMLEQNYPNPFNPETKISYRLPENGFISLTIHDLLGRKIKTLVSDYQQAGQYSVTWNGKDEAGNSLASGIYLYTLKTGNILQSKKMILMK